MCLCVASLSHVRFFASPWATAPARFLCSWGFSRQEFWSGLPCPPPGDLSNPGIKLRSPALQEDSLPSEPLGKPKNTGMGSLSFSRGSSQPRNQTRVFCTAGGSFNSWATWEALGMRAPLNFLPKYFSHHAHILLLFGMADFCPLPCHWRTSSRTPSTSMSVAWWQHI